MKAAPDYKQSRFEAHEWHESNVVSKPFHVHIEGKVSFGSLVAVDHKTTNMDQGGCSSLLKPLSEEEVFPMQQHFLASETQNYFLALIEAGMASLALSSIPAPEPRIFYGDPWNSLIGLPLSQHWLRQRLYHKKKKYIIYNILEDYETINAYLLLWTEGAIGVW